MPKTVIQTVTLNSSPDALFDTYLNSAKHAAVIGRRVSISRKPGGKFVAFNGMIKGKNLLIVPKRLIVQSWRATPWKKRDLDSILILTFRKAPSGAQIHLVHVNVPEHDYRGVNEGWENYYWKPWRAHLKNLASRKSRSRARKR